MCACYIYVLLGIFIQSFKTNFNSYIGTYVIQLQIFIVI